MNEIPKDSTDDSVEFSFTAPPEPVHPEVPPLETSPIPKPSKPKALFCTNCGRRREENARFCVNCGKPFND